MKNPLYVVRKSFSLPAGNTENNYLAEGIFFPHPVIALNLAERPVVVIPACACVPVWVAFVILELKRNRGKRTEKNKLYL